MNIIETLQNIILAAPAFITGIVLHECAHAWAAWKLGDPTAVIEGRLTLDPRAHFDPLGALMFVISMFAGVGFGWAKPVPVSYWRFRRPLRDMAIVAAAGPMTNFALAFIWYLALVILSLFFATLKPIMDAPVIGMVLSVTTRVLIAIALYGLIINFALTAFNLIPIPPLDGGRIAVALLPSHLGYQLARLEPFGLLILLLLIWLGAFKIIFTPFSALIALLLHPLPV
ncbi:MAG: site-2 protease family protein [Armatimonadota bacterium]|nr:site-2 protease family protein [Armatimonadota bacterium]MCX7776571.1 site-2 protease family protein [Armatimonadota bacterium]MDW8026095.1 site-2 protease family protein [Armatimonadota bacterium]